MLELVLILKELGELEEAEHEKLEELWLLLETLDDVEIPESELDEELDDVEGKLEL